MDTSMPTLAQSPSVMKTRLQDPRFRNWVASVLMLDVSKIELQKFIKIEMKIFFRDIWRNNPHRRLCYNCKTKSPTTCTRKGCPVFKVKQKINSAHRYGKPMFQNTNLRHCLNNSWAVAKCYMPKGYEKVKTDEETDFSGLVNVVINNTRFAKKIVSKHNPGNDRSIFHRAREVRNCTMHASPMAITDKCLQSNMETLVEMLKSILHTRANNAIEEIEKLESADISETDAVYAFKQSLKALTNFKKTLEKTIPKIKKDLEEMDEQKERKKKKRKKNTTHNAREETAKRSKRNSTTKVTSELTELGSHGNTVILNVEKTGKDLINTTSSFSLKRTLP